MYNTIVVVYRLFIRKRFGFTLFVIYLIGTRAEFNYIVWIKVA